MYPQEIRRGAKAGKVANNLRLSSEYVRQARVVLTHSAPLADSVLAGVKPTSPIKRRTSRPVAAAHGAGDAHAGFKRDGDRKSEKAKSSLAAELEIDIFIQ